MKAERLSKNQEIILAALSAAATLAIVIIAPNLFKTFGDFGLIETRKYKKRNIDNSLRNLVNNRFVVRAEGNKISLTKKGIKRIEEVELRNYEIKRPSTWDKKWRLVFFDIPESRRSSRDLVRSILQKAKFVRLQDSVWIHPFECNEFIELVKINLNLQRYFICIKTDSIGNNTFLEKHFKL